MRLIAWAGLGALLLMGGYAGFALTRSTIWLIVALVGLVVPFVASAIAIIKNRR
jgi:hypothetical protein